MGSILLECPKGTVFEDVKKAQIGALSNRFTSFTWCNQAAVDQQLEKEKLQNCSAQMNEDALRVIRKEMNKKCRRHNQCNIFFEKVFPKDPEEEPEEPPAQEETEEE